MIRVNLKRYRAATGGKAPRGVSHWWFDVKPSVAICHHGRYSDGKRRAVALAHLHGVETIELAPPPISTQPDRAA